MSKFKVGDLIMLKGNNIKSKPFIIEKISHNAKRYYRTVYINNKPYRASIRFNFAAEHPFNRVPLYKDLLKINNDE